MGTSSSYSAPPTWGPLKQQVSAAAGRGVTRTGASSLLRNYVASRSETNRASRGGGGGSWGGGGKAGMQAARGLAGFAVQVAESGLAAALKQEGLGELAGQPVSRLVSGLVDHFCGPGSTFDEIDARNAMSQFMDELLGDAESPVDVERILSEAANPETLELTLMRYFGHLIHEEFMRTFFEQVLQQQGDERADSLMKEIKDLIHSALENYTVGRAISRIRWFGHEGRAIANQIMKTALAVFGGAA